MIYKNCEICGERYFQKRGVSSLAWSKSKYCSLQCSGKAKIRQFIHECDFCGATISERPSHHKKTRRHFCNKICYSYFVKYMTFIEDHPRYGSGHSKEEKIKRTKARRILNHAIRDKKVKRRNCEICGKKQTEAHHEDYEKPLKVRWLCFKHHRQAHNQLLSL